MYLMLITKIHCISLIGYSRKHKTNYVENFLPEFPRVVNKHRYNLILNSRLNEIVQRPRYKTFNQKYLLNKARQ